MSIPKHWPRRLLWVAKGLFFIERFIPIPIFASIILFALPFTIAGIVVEKAANFHIFSRGVIFALIWMAIAPYLITYVYYIVDSFFDSHRYLFVDDEQAANGLMFNILNNSGSPKYLLVSIPLASAAIIIVLVSIYSGAPLAVKIWGAITFGTEIFVAGMGFWGIFLLIDLVGQICKLNLNFNPYHSDGYGGFMSINELNRKVPLLFFSGTLLFPLLLEVVRTFPQNELLSFLLWVLVIFYFALGFAGFIVPQVQIGNTMAKFKEKYLSNCETVLQGLLNELINGASNDKETAETMQIKINVYHAYFHERVMQVKESSWDWQSILQVASSLILPAIIAILQIFLK